MTETIYLSVNSLTPSDAEKFYKVDIVAVNSAVTAFFDVVMGRRIVAWDENPGIAPHAKFIAKDYGVDFESWTKIYNLHSDTETHMSDSLERRNITHAVFLGGGQNTMLEYEKFRNLHPNANIISLPETGGAALEIARKLGLNSDVVSRRFQHFSMFSDEFNISTNDERTETPKSDMVDPILKEMEREFEKKKNHSCP